MLYISFGLAGSGKTYFGKWFARAFNIHFEDADDWLTEEMRQCIQSGASFTQEMCDQYFQIVIQQIAMLKKVYPNIIISQAFYREKNRQDLLAAYPEAVFILIQTAESQLTKRLLERNNAVTLEYAQSIAKYFEKPQHSYIEINNSFDHDENALFAQCMRHPDIARLKNTATGFAKIKSRFIHIFHHHVPQENAAKDFASGNNLGMLKR
jgi:gluconate kinase